MRRLLVIMVVLMVPAVAHAGGGGVDTTGCSGYAEGTELRMQDSCFAGTAHFAPSDSTITIRNDGQLPHTFTAVDGSFDTGDVVAGQTAEIRVDEPGIYEVFCTLHGTAEGEGMAGVLIVGEAVPASMSAPLDTGAIEEAVAAETAPLAAALDRQIVAIDDLNEAQAELLAGLEQRDAEPATQPQPVVVPVESDVERMVILIAVGLTAGMAIAALVTALRMRRGAESPGLTRLEPSAEA